MAKPETTPPVVIPPGPPPTRMEYRLHTFSVSYGLGSDDWRHDVEHASRPIDRAEAWLNQCAAEGWRLRQLTAEKQTHVVVVLEREAGAR